MWKKAITAAGMDGTRLIGFKAVYVYDIAQTDGAEITCDALQGSADFTVSAGLDVRSLFEWILDVSPVPVKFRAISGSCRGYYDALADEIVLADSLTDLEKPKTLIHEIAHKLALSEKEHDMSLDDRPRAEVIAEGAAFVVCSYLGIDTGARSFSYVAAWGKDLKKIMSWGSAVMRVANRIIDLLEHRPAGRGKGSGLRAGSPKKIGREWLSSGDPTSSPKRSLSRTNKSVSLSGWLRPPFFFRLFSLTML